MEWWSAPQWPPLPPGPQEEALQARPPRTKLTLPARAEKQASLVTSVLRFAFPATARAATEEQGVKR